MLRVKAIAPLRLDDEEMVRRQLRYSALAGPEMEIVLFNLEGDNAPLRFDSFEEIDASERLTWEEISRTSPDRFDAVLPDCVLDPGLEKAAEAPVPAYGILRLAAGNLYSLGRPYAAVTRNDVIGQVLEEKVAGYGFSSVLVGREVLDIAFCFVSEGSGWNEAMAPIARKLADRGVTALLNGCSAVDIENRTLEGVAVIDPTEMALSVLGLAHRLGVAI
ncbi:MAG: aspartate/glutamate racemase family protein [Actinomycetota bacterium]|nr:aspartate/glutamate racemase family protein [Actinomycetota bacterium]